MAKINNEMSSAFPETEANANETANTGVAVKFERVR